MRRGQSLCHENNCPHYKLVDKTDDYEERYYEATDWISTRIEDDGLWAAHLKLKDYCSRQKDQGYELSVDTWPMLITDRPDGRYMSWFVSPGTREPENNDPYVTLERKPAGTIYVKVFSGRPSLEASEDNKGSLREALKKVMKDFDHSTSTGAAFEPILYFNHHNEVWIQAKPN
ncbi:heme-binding protein soul2 isoform X2 [Notolabrus celidotus]|uniref:heme-binding protein soul2 isoform X2 n=1 Tax=Notolabrus celidotus TaxID=1203425 RepID=UPI00148FF81D|nr:heme-binding protein soul2 isoform X2 [Notolabrus celidotus]